MAYDKSLDRVLHELEPCTALADEKFMFRIRQYNGGDVKLAITRTFWYEPEREFRETSKLGRLTLENVIDIQKRLSEAKEYIEAELERQRNGK